MHIKAPRINNLNKVGLPQLALIRITAVCRTRV
jgi:hypothetical protein